MKFRRRRKALPVHLELVVEASSREAEVRPLLEAAVAAEADLVKVEQRRVLTEDARLALADVHVCEYLGTAEPGEHARRQAELEREKVEIERQTETLTATVKGLYARAGDVLEAEVREELEGREAALRESRETAAEHHRIAAMMDALNRRAADEIAEKRGELLYVRASVDPDAAQAKWRRAYEEGPTVDDYARKLRGREIDESDIPRHLRKRVAERVAFFNADAFTTAVKSKEYLNKTYMPLPEIR